MLLPVGILVFQAIALGLSFILPAKQSHSSLDSSHSHETEINLERVKRNHYSQDHDYNIKFTAFGNEYEGKLERPKRSIFSENFKYLILEDASEDKKLNIREATPNPEELREIEESHFVSPEFHGSISVQISDGEVRKIRGTFGDVFIDSDVNLRVSKKDKKKRETTDNEISTDEVTIFVSKREEETSDQPPSDYITSSVPADLLERKATGRGSVIGDAEPELLVIVDYTKYKELKGVTKDILDYMGVFFHGVNNLFAHIAFPKIQFRIAAVTSMSTPESVPFLEQDKKDVGLDVHKWVKAFGRWVFSNKDKLPKHDMAILLTGLDIFSIGGGNLTRGAAVLKGACFEDEYRKETAAVACAEDIGQFKGIMAAVHELAHNLGAPHDGDMEAKDCPWDDGHIMSYKGWGTKNKFLFSKCSINLMKDYISSKVGACLLSIQNKDSVPISKDFPGDKVDPDNLCKQKTNSSNAVVDNFSHTPSENCKELKCAFTTPDAPWQAKSDILIGQILERMPCGNGGRCTNGECTGENSPYKKPDDRTTWLVEQGVFPADVSNAPPIGADYTSATIAGNKKLTMDKLCKIHTKAPNAVTDLFNQSPTQHCEKIRCAYSNVATPLQIGFVMFIPGTTDGLPCGDGGECSKSVCTGEKTPYKKPTDLIVFLIEKDVFKMPKGAMAMAIPG